MEVFLVVLAIAIIWLLLRTRSDGHAGDTASSSLRHTSTDEAPTPALKPTKAERPDDEQLRDAMRTAMNVLLKQIGNSSTKTVALKDLNRIAADMEQSAGQDLAARCVRVLTLQVAVNQGVVPAQDALRMVSDAEANATSVGPTTQLYRGARRALEAAKKSGGASGTE